MSRFNFVIKYRPGKLSQKPDALSRRSQDQPVQEAARKSRKRPLLDPSLFIRYACYDPRILDPTLYIRLEQHEQELYKPIVLTDHTIQQLIEEEYEKDTFI